MSIQPRSELGCQVGVDVIVFIEWTYYGTKPSESTVMSLYNLITCTNGYGMGIRGTFKDSVLVEGNVRFSFEVQLPRSRSEGSLFPRVRALATRFS